MRIVRHIKNETKEIDLLSGKAERIIEVLKERRAALITTAVTEKVDVRVAA